MDILLLNTPFDLSESFETSRLPRLALSDVGKFLNPLVHRHSSYLNGYLAVYPHFQTKPQNTSRLVVFFPFYPRLKLLKYPHSLPQSRSSKPSESEPCDACAIFHVDTLIDDKLNGLVQSWSTKNRPKASVNHTSMMCICMYIFMYVCIYIYTYIYIWVCTCYVYNISYICIYLSIYLSISIYIYIYVYIYRKYKKYKS